jgi:hypothetical protein
MSMCVLASSNILAVGADDFKIRFSAVENGCIRQELTYDTAGRWPMCMTVFEFAEDIRDYGDTPGNNNKETAGMERDKRDVAPWFCWGDNSGNKFDCLHVDILIFCKK